jgi:hypothetical protein
MSKNAKRCETWNRRQIVVFVDGLLLRLARAGKLSLVLAPEHFTQMQRQRWCVLLLL